MSQDVRSDAELLEAICNEAPHVIDRVTGKHVCVCPKQIAAWTDRSIQTISDYRVGKTNIPAEFWKRFLEHCFDARVFSLFVPDNVDFDWCAIFAVESDADFFREAVKLLGAHHKQQHYIAELLADGRIDELDAATVKAYSDAHARHRMLDFSLHRAIVKRYQRSQKAGVR